MCCSAFQSFLPKSYQDTLHSSPGFQTSPEGNSFLGTQCHTFSKQLRRQEERGGEGKEERLTGRRRKSVNNEGTAAGPCSQPPHSQPGLNHSLVSSQVIRDCFEIIWDCQGKAQPVVRKQILFFAFIAICDKIAEMKNIVFHVTS